MRIGGLMKGINDINTLLGDNITDEQRQGLEAAKIQMEQRLFRLKDNIKGGGRQSSRLKEKEEKQEHVCFVIIFLMIYE